MFSPARLATARTVSVSAQDAVTPLEAKVTWALASSAGVTSSMTGASASVATGAPKLSW